MSEQMASGDGMNELLFALARVDQPKVEILSDAYAEDGLVRLVVRSDSTISVEIDPYAAEEVTVDEVERHLKDLFKTAKFPAWKENG